jgi:hypothetical protein
VALSSTEAEYVGLCMAAKEAIWLKRMLNRFEVETLKMDGPVLVLADVMLPL